MSVSSIRKCFKMPSFTLLKTPKKHYKLVFHISILLLYFCDIILGAPDINLDENASMAQCRATCLQKFTSRHTQRDEECNKNSDCDMCWNSCRMFQGNLPAKSTLCRDHTACFPGCQTACKFYEDSASKNLTPPFINPGAPLLAYMAPPKLLHEGQLVWEPPRWPRGGPAPSSNEVVIYIVMINVKGIWNEQIQTPSTKAVIPKSIKESEIRVFAVTTTGIVAYAEPSDDNISKRNFDVEMKRASDPNPHEKTADFGNSREAAFFESVNAQYDDEKQMADQEPPSVPVDHSWEISLDLLSVGLLASVEVSWELRGSDATDYMVSWTESSGGISGHMVTKQDKVEISLWSGQHYSIQVELLDQHGNSVLRSMPKTISFGSPEPSAPETSAPPPKRLTTTQQTVTLSSLTTGITYSTVEYPNINRRNEFDHNSDVGYEGGRDNIYRDFEYPKQYSFPHETTTTTLGPLEDNNLPRWKNEASYNHVTFTNSRKEISSPEEPQNEASSSLMAWAACLGVGALVILILIVWAIRTLKKSTVERQDNRRANDYLSETTASSVNSSNMTTCSHLSSRGSRVVHESEEPPWTYETFYRVNQPLTLHGLQRSSPPLHGLQMPSSHLHGLQRPPPPLHGLQRPPPPLHAPPSPPAHNMHSVISMPRQIGIPLNIHQASIPLTSTQMSVNPSLVTSLSNHNCYGNL